MKQQLALIDGEQPVALIKEHWTTYAAPVFLIIASWFLYFVCEVASASAMQVGHALSVGILVSGHVLLLLFHHAAFYRLFGESTHLYLLTNSRILMGKQRLWVSDTILDIPLWKVRSMEVKKKGFWPHLLDYGSIVLNRGELFALEHIPHPQHVHSQIAGQIQSRQPTSTSEKSIPDV